VSIGNIDWCCENTFYRESVNVYKEPTESEFLLTKGTSAEMIVMLEKEYDFTGVPEFLPRRSLEMVLGGDAHFFAQIVTADEVF
jgi:hypothetical protein